MILYETRGYNNYLKKTLYKDKQSKDPGRKILTKYAPEEPLEICSVKCVISVTEQTDLN